jgi:nucleotide-binding universal stress UspA family protein
MTTNTQATSTAEIIMGLDQSPASVAALHWAAEYAARTGGFIRVVHAFELEPSEMYGPAAELRQSMFQELRETLSPLARDTIGPTLPPASWQLDIVEGVTGRVLVDAAKNAELLVLGTGAHSGVRRLLGSVSHYCLSHATTPVVAVPGHAHNVPTQHAPVAGETPVGTSSR